VATTKPEQDIAALEAQLRQLEREYDLFFAGVRKGGEPAKEESAVLAIVKAYASRPLQNPTLAFKYASLVARYNALRANWSRRLRAKEEGRAGGAPVARTAAVAHPEPKPQPGKTAANPAEYLAASPMHEPRRIEQLLETYVKMRKACGESAGKLTVEGFQKALADKVEKIKREQGCEAVLIRVVADQGRTRIVAKPFRRQSRGPEGSP
jgi:hypothetical protein